MARAPRIQWPGALYHVTHRGNERSAIFRDDRDTARLVEYLRRVVERFAVRVHAVCLMPNHYHAEIETPRGNLATAMHWLNTTYTSYFNWRHGRSGHLFQGRYKSAMVEKESHLVEVTRYIHLNPVRAGLVSRPEAYPWSSYRDYVSPRQRWEWLETAWTLEQFGGVAPRGRLAYRQFVEDGMAAGLTDPIAKAVSGMIVGGEAFVASVSDRASRSPGHAALLSVRMPITPVPIGEVIRVVSEVTGADEETIRARGRHDNEPRELAIYLAQRHTGETNVVIGAAFGGVAGTNVSYAARKVEERLRINTEFREVQGHAEEMLQRLGSGLTK